jgi:hypothetical protein
MEPLPTPASNMAACLALLRAFFFPHGEDMARQVRGVKAMERGEIRAAPTARWIPYTAENLIEATCSGFRWDARMSSGIRVTGVTDAYENSHGRLVVKAGGLIPVKKLTGNEFDIGELQRYLASLPLCPPALLNHSTLEWTASGPHALRLRDRSDPNDATVQFEIAEDGCPLACRADRPRGIRKEVGTCRWVAAGSEFRELENMRVATRIEASWELPEGLFTYLRGEVTSFTFLR